MATTPNGRADAVTPLPKATRDFCGGAAAGPVGDGSEGDCSKTDGACFALSAERPLPDATRGSSGKAAEGDGGCGGATGGAGECFALPAERQMPLRELLASLETKQACIAPSFTSLMGCMRETSSIDRNPVLKASLCGYITTRGRCLAKGWLELFSDFSFVCSKTVRVDTATYNMTWKVTPQE